VAISDLLATRQKIAQASDHYEFRRPERLNALAAHWFQRIFIKSMVEVFWPHGIYKCNSYVLSAF